MPRVTLGLAGALLAVSGVAAGCSQGDDAAPAADAPSEASADSSASAEESASPAASASPPPIPEPTPYLDVPGVELTDQGSELSFGESATVAWRPDQRRVGALDVRVRTVERAPLSVFEGWRLDEATRGSTAYFVQARIENVGRTDLSGVDVPLYAVDGDNTLVQHSTFASRFGPCESTPFPARFRPGRATQVCLVYLLPDQGELTSVSFRPTQEFDPITWTGEEKPYRPGRGTRQGQQQGGLGQGGSQDQGQDQQ